MNKHFLKCFMMFFQPQENERTEKKIEIRRVRYRDKKFPCALFEISSWANTSERAKKRRNKIIKMGLLRLRFQIADKEIITLCWLDNFYTYM